MYCGVCEREVDAGKICPDCFQPLAVSVDGDETYQRLKQAAAPVRMASVPFQALQAAPLVRQEPASRRSEWGCLGLAAFGLVASLLVRGTPSSPPAAPPLSLAHARSLLQQRAYARAVDEAKALLQSHTEDPRAVRQLVAQAAGLAGQWDEAVVQYQALGQTGELKKARRALGLQRLKLARQALAAGNVVEAGAQGRQALAALKTTQAPRAELAQAYAVLGEAAYLLDQLPEAKAFLVQALALAPADSSSRATLGRVRARLAPAPTPAGVADYLPPARRENVVLVIPAAGSQAYPTYHPRKKRHDDLEITAVPRYEAPPRYEPPVAADPYPTPPPSYSRPSSRVGELRETEGLLHR